MNNESIKAIGYTLYLSNGESVSVAIDWYNGHSPERRLLAFLSNKNWIIQKGYEYICSNHVVIAERSAVYGPSAVFEHSEIIEP